MKYTKRLLFAVVLAVITFSTSASAGEVDLKINGSVGLETSYATVVKSLGKPQKIKKIRVPETCGDPAEPYTEVTLTYPGLIIQLWGENSLGTQTVYNVKMSSASKWTVSGVKIGATQKEVVARLGKASYITKTSLTYINKGNNGSASFNFKDGKLVSVEWEPAIC